MPKNRVYNCDCNKVSLMITDVSNGQIIYKCDDCTCEFRKVIKKKKTKKKDCSPTGTGTKSKIKVAEGDTKQQIKRNILLFEANPLLTKFQEIEFQLKEQNIKLFDHKKETINSFIERVKKILTNVKVKDHGAL